MDELFESEPRFVSKSPTNLFEYVEETGEVRVVDKWRCEFSGECERWGTQKMHFPADDNVVKMCTYIDHWILQWRRHWHFALLLCETPDNPLTLWLFIPH